jgi:hypothetical protein
MVLSADPATALNLTLVRPWRLLTKPNRSSCPQSARTCSAR